MHVFLFDWMFGTGTESLVFWALLLSNLYEREKKRWVQVEK
jgi:hypothetical protein